MSHSINIYPELKLTSVVFEGDITIEELLEAENDIQNHCDFKLDFNGVYDFRNSKKLFEPKDLDKLKNKSAHFNPNKGKWCSLNSAPFETALSSLFQNKRIEVHPFEVFSSVEAASEFLDIDLSNILVDT